MWYGCIGIEKTGMSGWILIVIEGVVFLSFED
jgi:hypothetical protein